MRLSVERSKAQRELAATLLPRLEPWLKFLPPHWWVLSPKDGYWYPDQNRYARHDLIYTQAQQLYATEPAWDVEIDALRSMAHVTILLGYLKRELRVTGLPGPFAPPAPTGLS